MRVHVDLRRCSEPLQSPTDVMVTRRLIEEAVWIGARSHPQMKLGQFAADASPHGRHLKWGQGRDAQGLTVNAFPERERSIHQRACIVERDQPRREDTCRSCHRRCDRFRACVRKPSGWSVATRSTTSSVAKIRFARPSDGRAFHGPDMPCRAKMASTTLESRCISVARRSSRARRQRSRPDRPVPSAAAPPQPQAPASAERLVSAQRATRSSLRSASLSSSMTRPTN